MNKLDIVILAAGKGNRMKSAMPKVLSPLAGRPMISHIIDTARSLKPANIFVIYGPQGSQVKEHFKNTELNFICQSEQLGTGHAVLQALPKLLSKYCLVLYGDVPLISEETLKKLVEQESELCILVQNLENPTGYGRIVRDNDNRIVRIIEEKDISPELSSIKEVNTGILIAKTEYLRQWLPQVKNVNAQSEYYLTDIVSLASLDKIDIGSICSIKHDETIGVNTKQQLAKAERALQLRKAENLMLAGTTLVDPNRIDIRGELQCGTDTLIDSNCIFSGAVMLGNNVRIGANCFLHNVTIRDNSEILPFSHLECCDVGKNCRVGPFARVREGVELRERVKIGNFVEVKKSTLAEGSKINHLSYLGDSVIGQNVNIGAGTITCNFDGVNKNKTIIGDNCFVGSNTSLVAPVQIGENSTIGAGSTITKDAAPDKLTLSRPKQITVDKWTKPKSKSK